MYNKYFDLIEENPPSIRSFADIPEPPKFTSKMTSKYCFSSKYDPFNIPPNLEICENHLVKKRKTFKNFKEFNKKRKRIV